MNFYEPTKMAAGPRRGITEKGGYAVIRRFYDVGTASKSRNRLANCEAFKPSDTTEFINLDMYELMGYECK